jgi:hypothetical protein
MPEIRFALGVKSAIDNAFSLWIGQLPKGRGQLLNARGLVEVSRPISLKLYVDDPLIMTVRVDEEFVDFLRARGDIPFEEV